MYYCSHPAGAVAPGRCANRCSVYNIYTYMDRYTALCAAIYTRVQSYERLRCVSHALPCFPIRISYVTTTRYHNG